jgi:hypothetical protein
MEKPEFDQSQMEILNKANDAARERIKKSQL